MKPTESYEISSHKANKKRDLSRRRGRNVIRRDQHPFLCQKNITICYIYITRCDKCSTFPFINTRKYFLDKYFYIVLVAGSVMKSNFLLPEYRLKSLSYMLVTKIIKRQTVGHRNLSNFVDLCVHASNVE